MTIFDMTLVVCLSAYVLATFGSTMLFDLFFSEKRVSSAGLLVFAICWPFFVARGFVRMLAKGWRELDPSDRANSYPEHPDD